MTAMAHYRLVIYSLSERIQQGHHISHRLLPARAKPTDLLQIYV